MTSRCRISHPGEAIGSSILCVGGQALTGPGVSTSTNLGWAGEFSRSRPPDLQIHSRRFGPMSSPSPATHTYKCAPGDLPMSSWSPPTRSHKKGPSNDSPFITGKSVVTTWFMRLGKLMFVNHMFHRLVAGRMHQPASDMCFETFRLPRYKTI